MFMDANFRKTLKSLIVKSFFLETIWIPMDLKESLQKMHWRISKNFKNSDIPKILSELVKKNKGKNGVFAGADEITFYFEWCGEYSFAGRHQEGDVLKLYLIDVFIKKKGYIEPKAYYDIFCKDERLDTPELVYKGILTNTFVKEIWDNDWTKPDCLYPMVKEGVVCRLSSLLKGQRMPKVKFKTKWWIDKLHEMYTEECLELE